RRNHHPRHERSRRSRLAQKVDAENRSVAPCALQQARFGCRRNRNTEIVCDAASRFVCTAGAEDSAMRWRFLVLAISLAGASWAPPDAGTRVGGCVETLPQGMTRPSVNDTIPDKGKSGYVSTLTIELEHGKGETVLPGGLKLQVGSDAAEDLRREG